MSFNDELHVAALLQRYCEDNCTAEERAYIEGNPALLRRAAAMHREDAALQQLFSNTTNSPSTADDRPSPQDLVAYVDGTLAAARRRFVEQCAERDPEIQAEIQLLRQLGRNPLTSQ